MYETNLTSQIKMAIRAKPGMNGSEGFQITRSVLNDTGSTAMSLSRLDAQLLGVSRENYDMRMRLVNIKTQNGILRDVLYVKVEIDLMKQGQGIGEWFEEDAYIGSFPPGHCLVSGRKMRDHYYFATAPGNSKLLITKHKASLMTL